MPRGWAGTRHSRGGCSCPSYRATASGDTPLLPNLLPTGHILPFVRPAWAVGGSRGSSRIYELAAESGAALGNPNFPRRAANLPFNLPTRFPWGQEEGKGPPEPEGTPRTLPRGAGGSPAETPRERGAAEPALFVGPGPGLAWSLNKGAARLGGSRHAHVWTRVFPTPGSSKAGGTRPGSSAAERLHPLPESLWPSDPEDAGILLSASGQRKTAAGSTHSLTELLNPKS